MIHVKFMNLIRSKYHLSEMTIEAPTLGDLMQAILSKNPMMNPDDLYHAVIFVNQKQVMHLNRINHMLNDGDQVIFTHFVGGG